MQNIVLNKKKDINTGLGHLGVGVSGENEGQF